jgi:hypothetical protein
LDDVYYSNSYAKSELKGFDRLVDFDEQHGPFIFKLLAVDGVGVHDSLLLRQLELESVSLFFLMHAIQLQVLALVLQSVAIVGLLVYALVSLVNILPQFLYVRPQVVVVMCSCGDFRFKMKRLLMSFVVHVCEVVESSLIFLCIVVSLAQVPSFKCNGLF